MTKDEALKLALDALETPSPMGQYKAITAIKEALAQPTSSDYALGYSIGFGEGHSAGKALAQPEQDNTYGYASRLATAIWQKHYMKLHGLTQLPRQSEQGGKHE